MAGFEFADAALHGARGNAETVGEFVFGEPAAFHVLIVGGLWLAIKVLCLPTGATWGGHGCRWGSQVRFGVYPLGVWVHPRLGLIKQHWCNTTRLR